MLNLTIAVLTWKNAKTLKNTLESYEASGLLQLAKEKIIFIQENNEDECEIAKKYGFSVFSSSENIGISSAYEFLLQQAKSEYFLFLENDWVNIETKQATHERLISAIKLLQNGEADCIRLRHKYHYGEPLHTLQFKGNELSQTTHLMDCIHWIEDPSLIYGEYINKVKINNDNWFFTTSQFANYTNNPCLYKTKFIKNLIFSEKPYTLTEEQQEIARKYAEYKNVDISKISLELNLQNWWSKQNFKVAASIGLFSHSPISNKGNEYDFIFSIGSGCSCSYHLRRLNFQDASYPFDWVTNNSDFKIADAFKNNFKDYFLYENLEELANNIVIDKNYNINYVHDFNGDIKEQYISVNKKIKRRIKRLIRKIKRSRNILMVYETSDIIFDEAKLITFINKIYNRRFELLYLIHGECNDAYSYNVNNNIKVVYFNNKGSDWKGNEKGWDLVLNSVILKNRSLICKIIDYCFIASKEIINRFKSQYWAR